MKILLNYQLKNEVSWANFNTYKRIFNWQPFMHRVYRMQLIPVLLIFKQRYSSSPSDTKFHCDNRNMITSMCDKNKYRHATATHGQGLFPEDSQPPLQALCRS